MRDIMIRPVLNGWVVKVGCQHVVYTVGETLLGDLRDYMYDAEEFEKKFIATAINKDLLDCPAPSQGLKVEGLARQQSSMGEVPLVNRIQQQP